MTSWYASRFTGLFTQFGLVPPRPHDPAIAIWAGPETYEENIADNTLSDETVHPAAMPARA